VKKSKPLPKVFGIGLNKTGTTTLGECGKILGYRCTSCDRALLKEVVLKNDFTLIKNTVDQFDLFEDWPWPLIYRELDQMYPGSKFILTTRKSEDVWIDSIKSYSMKTSPIKHCRKLAYGFSFPHKHEQQYLDFYRKHNDNVRDYFSGRSSDFIELCWENGDDFEKLSNFLECNNPEVPLPHANKGIDNQVSKSRLFMNRLLSFF